MGMSTTECTRCRNEGLETYKHVAGGVCFLCGRTPKGHANQGPMLTATARERAIGHLKTLINRAGQEAAAGTLADWLDDTRADIAARLASAPVDVAERARVAFARLGVRVAA